MRDAWLENRIAMTKKFGLTAVVGVAIIALGFSARENSKLIPLVLIGFMMIVPFFIHEALFTIWHWKRRYRGEHSDLWGAILVIETSGWFKIVYWFRHILPDWRGTGRYSD